jgi:uncharacterized membrane protein YkvA (DUF1232 family)
MFMRGAMPDDQATQFDRAHRQAKEYAADRPKVSGLLHRAERKAYRDRSRIGEMWETLQALLRLLTAWAQGRYRVIPWRTLVLAIAGILYFLDPLDLFPDPIPLFGYLDDAGVLALVVRAIQKDIDRFVSWERANY